MNHIEQIENAISYIEDNLLERIQLRDVAKEACFSKYHFIRIFQAFTGETVWSYLRKRRLTRASQELILTKKPINEIAFDYQFDSPEAFTRSFKALYHQTPGVYRRRGINQLTYSRAKLTTERLHHLAHNLDSEPKIRECAAFHCIGLQGTTKIINNQLYNLWDCFLKRINQVEAITKPLVYFEIHPFEDHENTSVYTEETVFSKIASIQVSTLDEVPDGMIARTVPEGKYAVFTHRGSIANIQMSYDYIWGTWFARSGHLINERDDFERYDEQRFKGVYHPETEVDIYIPIK